ncbi:serine hydroxymethyltransferase, partial [Virgibacillus halophilus]
HLLLLDVSALGLTGKTAEKVLDDIGITTNKNTIPFDKESPFVTSGVRIGTAAVTTRGFQEEEMKNIAAIIAEALKNTEDQAVLDQLAQQISDITARFPLYAYA